MLVPFKRWKYFAAMALVGDGVMALVYPQRDAQTWKAGPKAWQSLMQKLQEHPTLTRAIGLTEIAGGIYWVLSQKNHEKEDRAA
jgi:uncharacterized protein YjeT (DUF2065 family)